ncbi:MAG TPA: helix-turn-helix domain-containing protein [Jatrophihabitans sp.]|nr:helix-turn-helix domain-containing protein [Jatrophihabitans sp.]
MLLRDLLAVPELRLALLHEPPGARDRQVRRVCATDLLHPGRYLSGDDLVLTGLVWRRSPEDSEVFVRALAAGGASALAAGDALLGSVPDDVVAACRRHGLPLIEVSTEVSFADIIEYLVAAVTAERGERLSASLGRQRKLLAEVAAGRSLAELGARLSAEIGAACRVLTATGRAVVAGSEPLRAADLDRITATFLTAPRLPVATEDRAFSIFPVGPALENRLTSWFVVVDGDCATWPAETVEVTDEFASIAALDRSRLDEGARAIRHIAEEALALADAGGSQLEIGMRLRQVGMDPAAPLVAVVAEAVGRPELVDLARAVVDDVTRAVGPAVVGVGADGRAVALLSAPHDDVPGLVRSALLRLTPAAERTPLAVGISAPSAPGALSGALEEARYACRLAELRGGPVSVVTGDELTSYVLLLAAVPDEVRRTFATRLLGPVLDHDRRNATGLRETLETFLNCSGSWSRAAELLHLHVNTVRYRIERVEQLTGRDLSRMEDRVDIFLALRSLRERNS